MSGVQEYEQQVLRRMQALADAADEAERLRQAMDAATDAFKAAQQKRADRLSDVASTMGRHTPRRVAVLKDGRVLTAVLTWPQHAQPAFPAEREPVASFQVDDPVGR